MFNNISEKEYTQLKDAIALITVYIAGADGKIDEDETQWASKLTKIRAYATDEVLNEFYEHVGVDFEDRLNHFIETLPTNLEHRNKEIEGTLSQLNPILAKLDNLHGAHLYKSYTGFAKHVAKASGGFLGFGSISPEEKKLIGLSAIAAIELEEGA